MELTPVSSRVNHDQLIPSHYSDLYKSIESERNVFAYDVLNDKQLLAHSRKPGGTLTLIEDFVRSIEAGGNAFTLINKGRNSYLKKGSLASYYGLMRAFLAEYSEHRVYSPHVDAFFEVCIKQRRLQSGDFHDRLDALISDQRTVWQTFNDVIGEVREILASSEFKRKLYSQRDLFKKGFGSSKKYINALFDKYARMLILRLDFGFRSNDPSKNHSVDLKTAQAAISKFLNNKRSKSLYKNLVGYIWRLEYGEQKGYHFHLFFFFDGSRSRKDEFLASEIGEDWKKITDGAGIYYSCNAHKQMYKRLGIGMISHDDVDMRANMLAVLAYMHKEDQILKERLSGKSRAWGRGEMPIKNESRTGRPRRTVSTETRELQLPG